MSARYYWISFIVVLVLTVAISWLRQTRTKKEFFTIMAAVAAGLVVIGLLIAGLAKLLEALGIAQSGF
ncbi:hypothetical protein NITGR_1040040 [Nitrospina gracilis 3/211]|uniref:Uncharacterized protein n=1 Tax=Nitrospina gracilis (strain 3/211) TaxID=1266370 RepID=M1YUZ8_NITG3|nr:MULTISPECIES: hypothetical protein [Nitrospina]MCF8722225.1 preprotein translocase subunit SecE [Nitrospina sp. Nb-3]CCQ89422.1 hypothetical protein NITGR_1040040 [Nitrospina gracilis 3/211]